MVLSVRRSLVPSAQALAWFPAARAELILAQIERVAHTSVELAYHLCTHAPEVLRHLPDADVPVWVLELLEVYDRTGTQGGIRAMQGVAAFAATLAQNRGCQRLDQARVVLDPFVAGLAGRRLKLAEGDAAWTDSETLFVPATLTRFPSREANYRLYKALIAQLWAQNWFGTWRGPFLDRLAAFPDPGRALALFQALETLRLDACIARELPGLGREMGALDGRRAAPRRSGPRRLRPWRPRRRTWSRAGAWWGTSMPPARPRRLPPATRARCARPRWPGSWPRGSSASAPPWRRSWR